jgi:hypothetical protein
MFHNVQSTFFSSYDDFIKNELTIGNEILFQYGPYFTNKKFGTTIKDFSNLAKCLNSENSPKSSLRSWLSELHFDETYAESVLKRINQVINQNAKRATNNALREIHKDLSLENLFITLDDKKVTPIHDVISLVSITGDK